MNLFNKIKTDPFMIFFPMGTVWAILGVLYWPLVFKGWLSLSTDFHTHLMIYGFLVFFIVGFITTALPRMTKTFPLSSVEILSLFISNLLNIVFIFLSEFFYSHITFMVSWILLMVVLGRRFLKKKRSPPVTFVYIPFAFLFGLAGGGCFILVETQIIQAHWIFWARLMQFQMMPLFLILGVGGFLIRSILGWAPSLPESKDDRLPVFSQENRWLHFFLGLVLLVGFFVQNFWGHAILALMITFFGLCQLKLYKFPKSKKLTSYTLFFSVWVLILGFWFKLFGGIYSSVSTLHLIYMGGFGITTIAVGSRVILAHTGYSNLLTGKYFPFILVSYLLFLALFTRAFAEIAMPQSYVQHLIYASYTWIVALIIWVVFILAKIVIANLKST